MGRLTWTRTTTAGALGALTLALALAGCSPDQEPAPSPTTVAETTEAPSPTPTPTETPSPTAEPTPELTVEQQHVAEAEQTVRDYYAAVNQMTLDGYASWTVHLSHFWGHPDVSTTRGSAYQAAADAGESATGQVLVDQLTALKYIPDPGGAGHEQVRLEYCADTSGVQLFDSAGAAIETQGPPRFVWTLLMQRQDDGAWTINEMTAHPDRVC